HGAGGVPRPRRIVAQELADRALEVRHRHGLAVLPDREHARFRADRVDVGARGPVAAGRQHAVIDLAGDVHLSGMNLEDRHTGFGTRHRNHVDAVEPSWPQKGLITAFWTIARPG